MCYAHAVCMGLASLTITSEKLFTGTKFADLCVF